MRDLLRRAALALILVSGEAGAELATRPFTVEAAVGIHSRHTDAYTDTLGQFGYHEEVALLPDGHYDLAFACRANPRIEVAATIGSLSEGHYLRSRDSVTTTFDWDSHAATAMVRGVIGDPPINAFVEVGGGLAWVSTDLAKGTDAHDRETQVGSALRGGLGFRMIGPWGIGWVVKLRRTWAPVLANLYDERHDLGGTSFEVGVCYGW